MITPATEGDKGRAEILQYLGDAAHADAADADEVDTAERSHEIVVGAQTTGRHAETSMQ